MAKIRQSYSVLTLSLATYAAGMALLGCSDNGPSVLRDQAPQIPTSAPKQAPAASAPEALPYPMIAKNPIYDSSLPPTTPKPGKNYSVKVKLIEHGVQISDADLSREFQMVEKAYSTCDGVNFHVNFVGREIAPATTQQDNLISEGPNGTMLMGDVFQSFFSQFPNSPETGLISINLFDALDPNARAELLAGQPVYSLFEGQAYDVKNMDRLYVDARSPQYRTKPLSELGGNSIIIGWDTTLYEESGGMHINDPNHKGPNGKPIVIEGWRDQSSALFAHEMGHVLMEKQDGAPPFKDHFCFGINQYCPQGYLMSGGGFDDRIFLDPKDLKTPIGYTPLPIIDTVQCEMLKQNPLVTIE
jgi:hypothetical protein